MFDCKINRKIKNDKILRWRIELSSFDFEIHYRPADCLTRAHSNAFTDKSKKSREFHDGLCHPVSLALLIPYVQKISPILQKSSSSWSTSAEHVLKSRSSWSTSAEHVLKSSLAFQTHQPTSHQIKPRFFRPTNPPLIKSTQPLERLSIDFEGPHSSVTQNRYLLVIIDEYSRFPFVFLVKTWHLGPL